MTVDATLRALAEPRRRQILRLVSEREMSASEIADGFPVTRQAISQHLRVLIDSGLLEERRDGTRRLYRTRREQVDELRSYLDEFWSGGLSRLKQEVEGTRD